MTSVPTTTALTLEQRRVAARIVYGASNQQIARQVCLSVDGVASHLSTVRKKMGCPGASRAVLVHALLTAREVPPPASIRPVPGFTDHDLTVIRAIADYALKHDIAQAIRVPVTGVRTHIDAVVAKVASRNAAHLVGLAHTWGLLGTTATSRPPAHGCVHGDPGVASQGGIGPFSDHSPGGPVYEMLPVNTDAARAEAEALAANDARRLAERSIIHSSHSRELLRPESGTAAGLYEDGVLVSCFIVHTGADMRHWGADAHARGLFVSLIPQLPDPYDQAGRLTALWLADHAARSDLEWVWREFPTIGSRGEASETLLDGLRELGWETLRPVHRPDGKKVVRLRQRAVKRNGITVAIRNRTLLSPAVSSR